MEKEIFKIIQDRLVDIEREHDVKIVYAVESGSRAWGFESTDSDYDIRFIYSHSKNWYLNILPKRDVIEYPIIDDFDYSGWDLRKTMLLINKSNPVFFEWMKSPIVYYKNDYIYGVLQQLLKEYFAPIASIFHYLHMANGNYRQYLQFEDVKIKKYFYVLRPLLACMWIESYRESPPIELRTLMTQITDKKLLDAINKLLQRKKSGVELGIEPRVGIINEFIESQIKHFENETLKLKPGKNPEREFLNESFIKMLDYTENARLYPDVLPEKS